MKFRNFIVVMIIMFFLILVGRRDHSSKSEKPVYISVNSNSSYEETFQELSLGILFDFNLKINHADNSWVTVWVEGYRNGEKFDPSIPLPKLSSGLSPNKVESGPVVFGMIHPNSNEFRHF